MIRLITTGGCFYSQESIQFSSVFFVFLLVNCTLDDLGVPQIPSGLTTWGGLKKTPQKHHVVDTHLAISPWYPNNFLVKSQFVLVQFQVAPCFPAKSICFPPKSSQIDHVFPVQSKSPFSQLNLAFFHLYPRFFLVFPWFFRGFPWFWAMVPRNVATVPTDVETRASPSWSSTPPWRRDAPVACRARCSRRTEASGYKTWIVIVSYNVIVIVDKQT